MPAVIDLSGKTALVTGASQGIGAAIARALHAAGAQVVINHPDSADGKTLQDSLALVEELNQERAGSAIAEAADVSDASAVQAMMERVRRSLGGLDILVNNAGILRDRSIAKMTLDEWQERMVRDGLISVERHATTRLQELREALQVRNCIGVREGYVWDARSPYS